MIGVVEKTQFMNEVGGWGEHARGKEEKSKILTKIVWAAESLCLRWEGVE